MCIHLAFFPWIFKLRFKPLEICWYSEIRVLYVLQPALLKIPSPWYKFCVKFAKRQNGEIYQFVNFAFQCRNAGLVKYTYFRYTAVQPRYLELPNSRTIFVIILLNFKTTRFTTACELRISIQKRMLVWWNIHTVGILQCSPGYLKLPTSGAILW